MVLQRKVANFAASSNLTADTDALERMCLQSPSSSHAKQHQDHLYHGFNEFYLISHFVTMSVILQENGTPQVVGLESHAFLRALPVALYLLFPYEDGKLGLEAIGSKQLHRGLKLLKQKPVIPAIGDLPLPLMHILHQLSAFLVAHGEDFWFSSNLSACQQPDVLVLDALPLSCLHVNLMCPRAVRIHGNSSQA